MFQVVSILGPCWVLSVGRDAIPLLKRNYSRHTQKNSGRQRSLNARALFVLDAFTCGPSWPEMGRIPRTHLPSLSFSLFNYFFYILLLQRPVRWRAFGSHSRSRLPYLPPHGIPLSSRLSTRLCPGWQCLLALPVDLWA